MQVGILGPLTVWRDGAGIDIGGPRLKTLLALLALRAGSAVQTSELIDGLWGDDVPAGVANALQSLVSRLRAQLAPDAAVEARDGGYALTVDPDQVDAHRFQRLADEGREALEAGRPDDAAGLLADALRLWRGDALAGSGDGTSLRAAAHRLDLERQAATQARIDADLARGRHVAVVAELEVLVAEHPFNEHIRGQLMRALYGSGRQADALSAYEDTRRLIREELGADPSPELQRVHIAVLQRSPELDAVRLPRTNLRAQLTSFVGREEDLRRIADLLDSSRLVTLIGPGGAGKTRLAAELGASVRERFRDGVWMVELAPLGDPASVPRAVLTALGLGTMVLTVPGGPPVPETPLERLTQALASSSALVLLDNCEHLLDACAGLADAVLAACPGCRILATSREPLGIAGEALWPLSSLALPPAGAGDAGGYAAVRLFLDRAALVRPNHAPGPGEMDDVAEICRRLDGMPLAIELAAARSRTLSLTQIAERLGDRFGLLTGGSRTALARHHTLRAVVDWSWDLLSDRERTLLRRLAVFSGGADLGSVERVCTGGDLDHGDVLDVLSGLVDKSLVEAAPAARSMRYRLLETVRAYAGERLREAGEGEAVRLRHAGTFAADAEAMNAVLRGSDQQRALDWFGRERDNLRAATRWAVDVGREDLALRLVIAPARYWTWRGNPAESREWALARGLAEEAATMLGAARSLRGVDLADWPDRAETDRITEGARSAIGAQRFDGAFGQGHQMAPAAAVEFGSAWRSPVAGDGSDAP